MQISILLPYKENFSPEYAGAVSLFVKDTVNVSSFKKFITVYGNTNYRSKKDEIGLLWNDRDLAIRWPKKKMIVSKKDRNNITLKRFIEKKIIL